MSKETKMGNRKNFRKFQKSEEIVEVFVMFNSEVQKKIKKDQGSQKWKSGYQPEQCEIWGRSENLSSVW